MIPNSFVEANKDLQKPDNMTNEECGNLPVFSDGKYCVSQWKMSVRERLHCLFHGYIWLRVHSGYTQPPVALDAQKTIFD